MVGNPTNPPRILFLFSDTGGGHRSATEAVIEALHLEYGSSIKPEMVDIFKNAPLPFRRLPELYPRLVRIPQAWGLGYYLSNGRRRARLINDSAWPYIRHWMRKLVYQHPSDLIVSVHPLANGPVLRALGPGHTPFITLVTDLVTTHALWYHRWADLCIVPTEAAGQRALKFGLKTHQIEVIGLPVSDRFCQPAGNPQQIRARLGWPLDRPLILLAGGGEGMGPLERTALAIASSRPAAALAIITGRNNDLRKRLEAHQWEIPTFVYGFVDEMPSFMQAADILLTKAGPGTITEAINAGLPMILYSRLPGQEDGNISYVISEGAGKWAPQPDQIVAEVDRWLKYPEERRQAAAACRRLARPQAARQIAHLLASRLGIKRTTSTGAL